MANLKLEIRQTDDRTQAIKAAIKELKSLEVAVGIPMAESGRSGAINNAELLFIHTNGSAVNNIPPRPVLEPAVKDDIEVISDLLKQAGEKAFKGDIEGMKKGLDKAGQRAENSAKGWFTNPKNGWAANTPETVKAKGSNKPLIDKGEMRKAITHVVRKK